MNEREKLFQSTSKLTSRIIDLDDQLRETHNLQMRTALENKITMLQDVIRYNQERISFLDGNPEE